MPDEMFTLLKEVSLTPSRRTLHGPAAAEQEGRGINLRYSWVIYSWVKGMRCWVMSRVDNVETCSEQIMADHVKLFTGLGSLEEESHIELEPVSVPFSLSTPRRVAIPLISKKLEALEASEIISRVEQPTE